MKKDAYYFSHDANARNDVKCIKLRRELGMEGYGIFWSLIEILREAPGHKLPLSAFEDIAYDMHVSKEKIEAVVLRYELFKVEENSFFSLRLIRAMEEYNDKKTKYIEAGRKGGQASVKHRLSNGQAIKGKKRKGNKEGTNVPIAPEVFYKKEVEENQKEIFINQYKKLINFLFGKNETNTRYEKVLSLPKQISYKQYLAVRELSEQTHITIQEKLDEMENYKLLLHKSETVAGTLTNWIRRDYKKQNAA